MILRTLCNSCFQPYVIVVHEEERHLLEELGSMGADEGLVGVTACPKLCGGKILLDNSLEDQVISKGLDVLHLTAKELYQAVGGMGLPHEIVHEPEVVDSLLKANRVVKCDIAHEGNYVYLHELTLENGVTIHLTSGLRGALVLKVTK